MELSQSVVAAIPQKVNYHGMGNFTVSAGESLEVKGDEEVLEVTVPAGKTWAVKVELHIDES